MTMNETQSWVTCNKCSQSFHSSVGLRLHKFEAHNQHNSLSPRKPLIQKSKTPIYNKNFSRQKIGRKRMSNKQEPIESSRPKEEDVGLYLGTPLEIIDKDIDLKEIELMVRSAGKSEDFIDRLSPEVPVQSSIDSGLVQVADDNDLRPFFGQPLQIIDKEQDLKDIESLVQSAAIEEGFTDKLSPGNDTNRLETPSSGSQNGNQDLEAGLYKASPLLLKADPDSDNPLIISCSPVDSRLKLTPVEDSSRKFSGRSKVTIASALVEQTSSDKECTCKRKVDGETVPVREKRARIQSEFVLDEEFIRDNETLEAILRQFDEHVNNNSIDVSPVAAETTKPKKIRKRAPRKKSTKKNVPNAENISGLNLRDATLNVDAQMDQIVPLTSSSHKTVEPKPGNSSKLLPILPKTMEGASHSQSISRNTTGQHPFEPIPHYLFLKASKEIESKHYSCTFACDFSCVGFQVFEDHMLSVHGRFPCAFCPQTFSMRNNRTRHIVSRVIGKQHHCIDCGSYFARRDSLKEHRFIHTKSYRDSYCCNCNTSFEKKATLLQHMKKCFGDQQLLTDKMTPAEIHWQKPTTAKKLSNTVNIKEEPVFTVIEQEPSPVSTPKKSKANIDALQKEKRRIMEVKSYLERQLGDLDAAILQKANNSQVKVKVEAPEENSVSRPKLSPQKRGKSTKAKKSPSKKKACQNLSVPDTDKYHAAVKLNFEAEEKDSNVGDPTCASYEESTPQPLDDYSAVLQISDVIPSISTSARLESAELNVLKQSPFMNQPCEPLGHQELMEPFTTMAPMTAASSSIPHASDAMLSAHTSVDSFSESGLESSVLTNMALAVANVDAKQVAGFDMDCEEKLLNEQGHKPYSLAWYLSL